MGLLSYLSHPFLVSVMDNTKISDIGIDFQDNAEGLVIHKSQTITDEFIKSLQDERFESKNKRANEFHRAASIPVILHEKWLSEGYDCTKEPIKKTLAKLKQENLDYFITSDKAF